MAMQRVETAPGYRQLTGDSYDKLSVPDDSDVEGSRAWQLGPQGVLSGSNSARVVPSTGQPRSGSRDPSSRGGSQPSGNANFKSVDASGEEVPDVKDAKPQIVDGIEHWPEKWGVTREQCLGLWYQLREEVESGDWNPDFTLAELVHCKIIPMTKNKGYGYALLLNKDDPKEVDIMVSHCWNENALEFLEDICRSTSDNEVLFICAFSLYQCEDDAGPSISAQLGEDPGQSPFKRVLQFINDKGCQSGPV